MCHMSSNRQRQEGVCSGEVCAAEQPTYRAHLHSRHAMPTMTTQQTSHSLILHSKHPGKTHTLRQTSCYMTTKHLSSKSYHQLLKALDVLVFITHMFQPDYQPHDHWCALHMWVGKSLQRYVAQVNCVLISYFLLQNCTKASHPDSRNFTYVKTFRQRYSDALTKYVDTEVISWRCSSRVLGHEIAARLTCICGGISAA